MKVYGYTYVSFNYINSKLNNIATTSQTKHLDQIGILSQKLGIKVSKHKLEHYPQKSCISFACSKKPFPENFRDIPESKKLDKIYI